MPRIVFKTTGGVETPVETTTGTTVLQAAWDNNIDIEGARSQVQVVLCYIILCIADVEGS